MASPIPCPGTTDLAIVKPGGAWENSSCPDGLSTRVPDAVIDVFSSGPKGVHLTMSNFDIEWRQLTWAHRNGLSSTDPVYDKGAMYSSGRYQRIDSSIIYNTYKAVEGLVEDARDGGLGFRNHTVPVGCPRGAEWKEDLLFT